MYQLLIHYWINARAHFLLVVWYRISTLFCNSVGLNIPEIASLALYVSLVMNTTPVPLGDMARERCSVLVWVLVICSHSEVGAEKSRKNNFKFSWSVPSVCETLNPKHKWLLSTSSANLYLLKPTLTHIYQILSVHVFYFYCVNYSMAALTSVMTGQTLNCHRVALSVAVICWH